MNLFPSLAEPGMRTLLEITLSNTALAGLLGLMIVCLGRVLSNRPGVRHLLWLLVLVKLVTPPLWQIPIIPRPSQPIARSVAHSAPQAPEPINQIRQPVIVAEDPALDASKLQPPSEPLELASNATPTQEPIDVPSSEVELANIAVPLLPDPLSEPAPSTVLMARNRLPAARTMETALLTLWATGSALWILLTAIRIVRFQRALRHATPAPVEITNRVISLAAELGLQTIPHVRLVAGSISPCVWSLTGRAVLILPVDLWNRLETSQQDTLLLHELAHLRRRDPLVRLVELAATALHWWNPVLWWARSGLHEAEEQCCDAWVVQTRPAAASAYATALVETLDFLSAARGTPSPHTVPVGASGLGKLHHISKRITMIMKLRSNPRLGWIGGLFALVLGILVLPSWATWASSQKTIAQGAEATETVIKQLGSNGEAHTIVYNSSGRLVSDQPSLEQGMMTVTTQDRTTGEVRTFQPASQDALELARTTVQIQRARLKKAKLLAFAKEKKVARLTKQSEAGSLPAEELEQAELDAAAAKADIEIAEAELTQAALKLTQLERTQAAPATPRTAAMNANPVTVTMQGPDGQRQQIIADISPTLPQSPDLLQPTARSAQPVTVTVTGANGQPQQVLADVMITPAQSDDLLPAGSARRAQPVTVTVPEPQQVQTTVTFTPAAKQDDRRSTPADRIRAANHLKQLMLALHNYESAHGKFPPLSTPTNLSWRVLILPFLGHADLYQQFHLDEPWHSEHNSKLLDKMPEVFRLHHAAPRDTRYVAVTGPGTIWDNAEGTRIADITDGTSNTVALIESPYVIPWTAPDDPSAFSDEHGQNPIVPEILKNGILAVTADGAAHYLHPKNYEVWKALCTRAGGEVISQEDRGTPARTTQANPGASAGGTLLGRLFGGDRAAQAERARAEAAAEEARAKAAAMADEARRIVGVDQDDLRAIQLNQLKEAEAQLKIGFEKQTEEFKRQFKSEFETIQSEKENLVKKLKTEQEALRKENEALKQKLEELLKK